MKQNLFQHLIPAINDMPLINEILAGLENRLEDHNPVLLSQLKEMVNRHAFILYPFDLQPEDVLFMDCCVYGYRL